MNAIPVFKNYFAGAPSIRLYVKNLSKQVEEKVGCARALANVCVYLLQFDPASLILTRRVGI